PAQRAEINGPTNAPNPRPPSKMLIPSMAPPAVRGHGLDSAGGAMLGMSILLGGRGLGALVGPLISARWAGQNDHRLRLGILLGYITIARAP
ncbi:MAG TPA: hypothetical protein VNH19_03460, partial [Candidatus Limnocylindrales bacterium]|nr:hypothetical protein [Candidatus Limnocylindrales bacterium]